MSMSQKTNPRIVIVGAGFGGLNAAYALRDAPVEVTIIDRQNHHLFQPLLYQVATAGLSPAEIAWPIRHILSRARNERVLLGEVVGVDVEHRTVLLQDGRSVAYDVLVLATGSRHSYFGHPEWERYAPGLKDIEDATAIRRRVLLAFERAEMTEDASRGPLLTFVIVGAGPTGVEMAGTLAELSRRALPGDFRSIRPEGARVILIEAGSRLLPAMPELLSSYAERTLKRMGVEVRTETLVSMVDKEGVEVKSTEGVQRIRAATVLWAAGNEASPAGRWIGAETDRAGRVPVGPDLTVAGHPEMFVIGDTALVKSEDGTPVPGIAPAARQQGKYVARVIRARIAGRQLPGPFRYTDYGLWATIGRNSAVIAWRKMRLTGNLAWWLWGFVHIFFLIDLRNRVLVATHWLWSYLTFGRGARLIVGPHLEGAESERSKVA
jgi:NADH:quinone reductase (non-electrogenic)